MYSVDLINLTKKWGSVTAVNNVIILLIIFMKLIAVQIYSTVAECS